MFNIKFVSALLALLLTSQAFATVSVSVSDDFTRTTDSNNWVAMGDACLTAGTGTSTGNLIPGCTNVNPINGKTGYTFTSGATTYTNVVVQAVDPDYGGALRLTPAINNQAGAIVSTTPFSSSQGLQITFTTYTYGGSADGLGVMGADGMSFFLQNSGIAGTTLGTGASAVSNIGEFGGSLGYSCAQGKGSGLTGGYLGLGMDEWGNFLNSGDNTATGIQNTNLSGVTTYGTNTFYDSTRPYYQPNRIGLRGAGNVSWYWLNKNYPGYYPSWLTSATQTAAVENTCKTGTLWNYATAQVLSISGNPTVSGTTMTVTLPSTSGFTNSDSVTLAGLTANAPARAISGTPVYSTSGGKHVTYTIASGTVPVAGSTVVIANVTPSSLSGSQTVASSPAPTATTFAVAVSSNPGTITAVSATAVLQTNVAGSYTISGLTSTTFDVTLASAPASITSTSGTVDDTSLPGSATNVGVAVPDYQVIPGGYFILPNTGTPQLIANETAGASRTGTGTQRAWPITYRLIITSGGLLSYMYSYDGGTYQSVLKNFDITTINGTGFNKLSFLFGFAGSTGGSTNIHEITCFAAQPLESSSSASANNIQGGQYRSNTQVFFASYNNNSWSGTVLAVPLTNTSGTLSLGTTANWDADCVLTGNTCPSTGSTTNASAMAPAARVLLAWDTSTGAVALESANITTAQKGALNTIVTSTSTTDSNGGIRLNWLRGDRTQELTTGGPLRVRTGVMGDVINSSPTWVGAPSAHYPAVFADAIHSNTGAETSYGTYQSNNAARLNVVYTGANDGLLHGFEAGSFKTTTTGTTTTTSFDSSTNDGKEVIGFMPSTVLSTYTASTNTSPDIVSLTDPTYGHNYFVDATPGTGDLYYGSAWHTWLVGGLGAGGSDIYALDVTDPSTFSETNAASLVKGDWTSSNITCTNDPSCGTYMGNSFGTPVIRRTHTANINTKGQWAIIFGNGLGSSSGTAGVYVGLVSSTGSVTFYWLGTGVGSSTTPNGISYVSPVDMDGDSITDYLYAGDLQGNVWRFDLTDSDPSKWAVSKYGKTTATPLFTAKDSSGTVQPITSSILVTATTTGGSNRIILGFGTGQSTPFASNPNNQPVNTYQSGQQTVYGIWDWDMASWNLLSTANYAPLTGPITISRSNLLTNSVSSETATTRTIAQTTVKWCASSSCTSPNNQYGWMFDLPDDAAGTTCTGTNCEQIVYNPVFVSGAMVLNTTIPPNVTPGQCSLPVASGWTQAFNMASGGGTPNDFFVGAGTGSGASVDGEKLSGSGSAFIVTTAGPGGTVNLITQTTGGGGGGGGGLSGTGIIKQIQPPAGVSVKRVSWGVLR